MVNLNLAIRLGGRAFIGFANFTPSLTFLLATDQRIAACEPVRISDSLASLDEPTCAAGIASRRGDRATPAEQRASSPTAGLAETLSPGAASTAGALHEGVINH